MFIRKLVIASLSTMVAFNALAGKVEDIRVTISESWNAAYGSIVSVRNSSNSTEYIGCMVSKSGSNTKTAVCRARNSEGVYKTCWSNDVDYVASAALINDASYVYFKWDENGGCSYITVYNASQYSAGGK